MKSAVAEVVVAPGSRHWRAAFSPKMAAVDLAAAIFVVVYRLPSGQIGFNLDESGEQLFCEIIREGRSWSEGKLTSYSGGSATQYVKHLFIRGQQQPITVSNGLKGQAIDDRGVAQMIYRLQGIDVDVESGEFIDGIMQLTKSFERICIHSIAQWETTIVTTNGKEVLKSLRKACQKLSVSFREVSGEERLPEW